MDETLRMTNLSPSSFREAEAYVNIWGYFIPKGWKVLAYNRGVHYNPENYPDPNQFVLVLKLFYRRNNMITFSYNI